MNMKNDLNKNQPAQRDSRELSGDSQPAFGVHPLGCSAEQDTLRGGHQTQNTLKGGHRTQNFLRNVAGFWELNFCGEPAVLKQDQGLFYISWLLAVARTKPITALDFAGRVYDFCGEHPDFRQVMPWICQLRDERQNATMLVSKIKALEAILDSEDELDPVKEEALREVSVLYNLQTTCQAEVADAAERTAAILWKGLRYLHASLATAFDGQGQPHPVLRPFARHLLLYLLIPSLRASCVDGVARFVYRRPADVTWETWTY